MQIKRRQKEEREISVKEVSVKTGRRQGEDVKTKEIEETEKMEWKEAK